MNLTVSNTNRILRSGNGPTVEYTGQDPIQVNNATHIISLNPTFSAQFAESGVEAKVDELSSCCEQVHSSISSLSSTVETISSELPDLEPYATKEWVEDQGYLTQVPDGYLTKAEAEVTYQPIGDYLTRAESGAFQPSGDYLTTGILNTLATKQDIRVTSSFIQGEIDYISGAISAYPNRDELSAAIENIPEYILSGNSNITATSAQDGKNVRWDLRVAATPVVTDTTIVGESGVYAHETQTPGQWQVELTQSAYSAINEVSNKLDKSFSSNFYPMTGNPSGFLTQHQDISNLATKDEVSAYTLKTEVSSISSQLLGTISAVSSEIPDVSNFITNISAEQTYQPIGDYQPAGDYATRDEVSSYLLKDEFTETSSFLQTEISSLSAIVTSASDDYELIEGAYIKLTDSSANKTTEISVTGLPNFNEFALTGDINALSSLVDNLSGNVNSLSSTVSSSVTSLSSDIAYVSGHCLTAHQDISNLATKTEVNTISSLLSAGLEYVSANAGTTYSAGEGIDISVSGDKTFITNNISAGPGISLVYDEETNKIRIDGEGREYSGVAPIQVNNTTNQISITGESLSAGPNIDIFSSGGYVVISAQGGNSFPITGSNGTTAYTANMDCSSVLLTTASSPAGGYVKQTVQGVQYEAYPSTDVSASWYNIINAANHRSNCYCIRFTNEMTAADLANYSAYDKVTVVHSNDGAADCNLYWDGNTKVFPSGLYCELVKGTNDQNQVDWFFTTSGWTNNNWWDWD